MFSGGRRLTRGMRGSPAPTCCASLPPSTVLHLAERRPAPARSYLPRHSPGLYQHGRHGNADRMPRLPPSSRPPPRRCRLRRPCRTCLHRERKGADGRPMPPPPWSPPQINLTDRHGHNRAVKHEELPPPNQECAARWARPASLGNCERKAVAAAKRSRFEGRVTQL